MKKYLLFLVAAMLATVARAYTGETFTYQGLKFKVTSEDDHTVVVNKNPDATGDISIPSFAVNGSSRYFVTEIGYNAFSYCSSLTSVTIPNSVTTIRDNAFDNCSSLTSVTIPNSVTTIGPCAFNGCGNLTSVAIPNSVTEIGYGAFCECRSLTSVNIPNSVTTIGPCAFNGCGNLTSVAIPNSVTEIGYGAFRECRSLTSVNIPNSVTEIGAGTFNNCISLTSITIPNLVTEIGECTFADCRYLKTIYNLNPTPQKIADNAFENVPTEVVAVYIPKGSYNDYFQSSEWFKFTDFREMGAFDVALSEQTLELTAGNTATVTATVTKDDDMTVESEKWTSSNPEVATVDNGVITAVAPGEAVIWFTVVDGYGVPHTESCTVTVIEKSGVAEIVTDTDAPVDVYNLQGVAVLRNAAATELGNLPAGLYIVRQGKSVKKIIVK